MPIRPGGAVAIRDLIAALDGADDVRREAAIARLAVIGPRAVERLLDRAAQGTSPRLKSGILRALETSNEPRAVGLAAGALEDPSADVASAAAALLRATAASSDSSAAGIALEALVTTALDRARSAAARTAALDALSELPASLVEPVRAALANDGDPAIAARARSAAGGDAAAVWGPAVEGRLPSSPEALKLALHDHATAARLTELQRLVDHVRAQEGREPDPARRAEWRAVRGALHQALASRGSRLALYDLRDSLMQDDGPLPVGFLAALEEVGDASCVEPLAAAYESSSRSSDTWWREHVARAFRTIVQREGLTRRHLVIKRALARWPDATAELMGRG